MVFNRQQPPSQQLATALEHLQVGPAGAASAEPSAVAGGAGGGAGDGLAPQQQQQADVVATA